jgi:hypothetical protein
MGNFVRPSYADQPAPEKTLEVSFDGPCSGCRWPDRCARDRRCWRPDLADKEETMDDIDQAAEVEQTIAICKIDGCTEPALQRKGIYGGLCREHRDQRHSNGVPPHPVANGDSGLVACAREVDEAKRDLEAAQARLDTQLERLTRLLEQARLPGRPAAR